MSLHREPETQGELEALRIVVQEQVGRIMRSPLWVKCATCGLNCPLWRLYRCYYCGLWICENCAATHFGKKRPLMGSIMEKALTYKDLLKKVTAMPRVTFEQRQERMLALLRGNRERKRIRDKQKRS